jgi:hypothetical protein
VQIVFEPAAGGQVPSIEATDGGRLTVPHPIRCAYLHDADGHSTAGLDTAGLDTAGLDAAGHSTAGLDTAGLDTAGLDTAGLDTAERGAADEFAYSDVSSPEPGVHVATRTWERDGLRIAVEDTYRSGEDVVHLTRHLRADVDATGNSAIRLEFAVSLPDTADRFCAPAMVYSPAQHAEPGTYVFNDGRLAYPLVTAWTGGSAVTLLRTSLPAYDDKPDRTTGQSEYPHRTDIGALGFTTGAQSQLVATWPYREGDRSSLLDANGTPASAYHPVGPDGLDVTIAYDLITRPAPTFADAVAGAYAYAATVNPPRPAELPFTLDEAIDLRLASLADTYTEWAPGAAGFRLNFDPDRGYDAEAKAFGASFTEHGMGGSHGILEYGFTGRQLNAAHMLAERLGGEWVDRADKVCDFFVNVLTAPAGINMSTGSNQDDMSTASTRGHTSSGSSQDDTSTASTRDHTSSGSSQDDTSTASAPDDTSTASTGFLYTLYSIDKGRPLFSCGDPDGPVMHYLGAADQPGTYTRMMTEAAGDLLLNYRRRRNENWLAACRRFAEFLLAAQEPDGSWYRAYGPDGKPLDGGWLGAAGSEGKASSAVPVPYLVNLASEVPAADAKRFIAAARAAGEYVLREQVGTDDYRGGTLDNPNVVDKEAAELAMAALLALHEATNNGAGEAASEATGKATSKATSEAAGKATSKATSEAAGKATSKATGEATGKATGEATGETKWLAGAERAAKLAVSWHLLWDVPARPGTRLAEAGVRSTGWGGINSTWGAGVTDIYSLFFLDSFVKLSRLTGDPLYEMVADLAAPGCQQILSYAGRSFGFADSGMQPEGISFCDQGVDAGLIAKGDTWGGLGWPYTAGTHGLQRYLIEKNGNGDTHVVNP